MFELVIACYFGKLNLTLGSVVPLAMFFSFSADITLICIKATNFEIIVLSSRYQKLDAKKNWDDMARRVVDVSTVEDFWQVGLGLSTFQLIGLTAGLPSSGTCLQPEGGSRLLAVQERNLPRLV